MFTQQVAIVQTKSKFEAQITVESCAHHLIHHPIFGVITLQGGRDRKEQLGGNCVGHQEEIGCMEKIHMQEHIVSQPFPSKSPRWAVAECCQAHL